MFWRDTRIGSAGAHVCDGRRSYLRPSPRLWSERRQVWGADKAKQAFGRSGCRRGGGDLIKKQTNANQR